MTALLRAENLVRRFGGVTAVDDVSFEVLKGEIFSLIGPNGAGKTTMFNLVSRVLPVTSGRILFDGQDITHVAPHRIAAIGMGRTFQNLAVFKHASVVDNLLVGRHSHMTTSLLGGLFFGPATRAAECAHRRRVEEIIDFLEIEHIRDMPVGALPSGLQKRVELGRALALQPRVVLLDEPTAMIAPKLATEIYEFIHGLPARGITVLLVDQNVRQCVRVSDHVYVLELGRNKVDGSVSAFAQDEDLRNLIADWVDYRIDA